jgi:hypothetical protein
MNEAFVLWCRRHPMLWRAVKKYPAYGQRVQGIFVRVLARQSLGGA